MNKKIITFFSLLSLIVPTAVLAAPTVTLTTPTATAVGDVVLVPVMLSVPDSLGINTFGARVRVSGPAQVTAISTGGSIFSLWPENPVITANSATFLGGVPGSVYGSSLRAVTLVLTLLDSGTVTITLDSVTAYAGDGAGTPVSVDGVTLHFLVEAPIGASYNEYTQLIADDTKAPDPFTLTLGRDPSFAGGAYFVSFSTQDSESGVGHYEAQENGGQWSWVTNPFVLTDQSLTGIVSIRAIDVAGNVRTETISFKKYDWSRLIVFGSIIVLIVFTVWYLRRRSSM